VATESKYTTWISSNWKGVAISTGLAGGTVLIILLYKKFFGAPGGNAPSVSNPKQDPVEVQRSASMFSNIEKLLPKDQLYYKSIADSLQAYLQSTTFYFSSDIFEKYFKDLSDAEFIAVSYFWGNREYTGSFWNNPFQGIDDKYGSLTESLKARCYDTDYQKIASKFSSTGII
jgi:hypothetical protein